MQSVGRELEQGVVMNGQKVNEEDWSDLWNWAAYTANDMLHNSGGAIEEDEEEDEEYEDEEEDEGGDVVMGGVKGKGVMMGSGGPAMPLEYTLAFLSNGYQPPQTGSSQR